MYGGGLTDKRQGYLGTKNLNQTRQHPGPYQVHSALDSSASSASPRVQRSSARPRTTARVGLTGGEEGDAERDEEGENGDNATTIPGTKTQRDLTRVDDRDDRTQNILVEERWQRNSSGSDNRCC